MDLLADSIFAFATTQPNFCNRTPAEALCINAKMTQSESISVWKPEPRIEVEADQTANDLVLKSHLPFTLLNAYVQTKDGAARSSHDPAFDVLKFAHIVAKLIQRNAPCYDPFVRHALPFHT
jgi:hypothetical protein